MITKFLSLLQKANRYLKKAGDIHLLQSSDLFDKNWYLANNPDVANAKVDPVSHYLFHGGFEGRDPGPKFSNKMYLDKYEGVKRAGINPLVHYLRYGRKVKIAESESEINFDDWIMPLPKFRNNVTSGIENHFNPNNSNSKLSEEVSPNIYVDKSIDIIICVHNALDDLKRCLSSVIPTLMDKHKIIIINDNSNIQTRTFLQNIQRENFHKIKLIHTPRQLYYTKSANLGLRESNADLSVLLNSDTIVSSNWLEKLIFLAYMNPTIGIVGPLSNAAHFQSIPSIKPSSNNSVINPLPKEMTIEDMNRLCEVWSLDDDLPLVPSIHGFCFCIKREVKEKLGFFDETTFPNGYGEENDYSFRAIDAGYKLVVATNTYVFHAKSKSYLEADRINLMKNSFKALVNKYPNRVEYSDRILRLHPILLSIRKKAEKLYKMKQVLEKSIRYFPLAPCSVIEFGKAFAANTINSAVYRHHGIVTTKGIQYTAFYKDEETVQVVKRNLSSGQCYSFDLNNAYSLSDAHNTISMGIDREDFIHLAICNHAGLLRYRISTQPGSIQSWSDETGITGIKEGQVTYPTFIMAQASQEKPLLFLYRSGYPERGEACIKQYSEADGKWSDMDHSILSGLDSRPWSSGPYWNHPAYDGNGTLHLSFVWRTSPIGTDKLVNNKGIDYARSRDNGHTWFSTNEVYFRMPITQINSETVFPIPPAANLMNQTSMALDSRNNPHIVFYSDDPKGIPQYQHLWFDGKKWRRSFVSNRTNDFALALTLMGNGTLSIPISRPEIIIDRLDNVYVIFRGDFTESKFAIIRLSPPDYKYKRDEIRILWDEPVEFAEPIIDRIRWGDEQILSMLVQKNYQPINEAISRPKYESIQIVDWDIINSW